MKDNCGKWLEDNDKTVGHLLWEMEQEANQGNVNGFQTVLNVESQVVSPKYNMALIKMVI